MEHTVPTHSVLAFILGEYSIENVVTKYELSSENIQQLESFVGEKLATMKQEIEGILNLRMRKRGTFYSYEEDIDLVYGSTSEYVFSEDLCESFPEIFEYNNHEAADLLREKGVFIRTDKDGDDPEFSCYYAYFGSEESARGFIDRLNAFVKKEGKKNNDRIA